MLTFTGNTTGEARLPHEHFEPPMSQAPLALDIARIRLS